MSQLMVTGLVSHRDQSPRIDIDSHDGTFHVQMGAEEAVHFALNIIKMAEATMADALLIRWAAKSMKTEKEALAFGAALMTEFRDFRDQMEKENRQQQGGKGGPFG